MKTIKKIGSFLLIIICSIPVHAQQGEVKMNFNYGISFPTGSFHQFIKNTSFNGFEGSFLYGVNKNVSLGLASGYNEFYQKYPRQIYKTAGGDAISAVVSNSIQTIPLLLKANYNFSPEKRIQPYAGIAAGGAFTFYQKLLGEFGSTQNQFKFETQPELGIYMPFNKHSEAGITLSAVYTIIPYNYGGVSNLNSAGIKLGISFPTKN